MGCWQAKHRRLLLLLNHLADPKGFPPIVAEAKIAISRLQALGNKLAAANAPAAAPEIGNAMSQIVIAQQPAPTPSPPIAVALPPSPDAEKASLPLNARIEAVLSILKGTAEDQVIASSGASEEQLQRWTEIFMKAGFSALSEHKQS